MGLTHAAPSAKALIILAGADHNDIELLAGDEMMAAIRQFLGQLV